MSTTYENLPIPLAQLDGLKIAREAQKLHPARPLNQADLDSWELQERGLRERIASCKTTVEFCERELLAVHKLIDGLEDKIEKLEPMASTKPAVRAAVAEHKTKLAKLQESVNAWSERRGAQVRIMAASQRILDELPWADIKRLREERRMLESL